MSMITVCPYCGPETMMYAGRIVMVPCASCKARLAGEPDVKSAPPPLRREQGEGSDG